MAKKKKAGNSSNKPKASTKPADKSYWDSFTETCGEVTDTVVEYGEAPLKIGLIFAGITLGLGLGTDTAKVISKKFF